MPRLTYVGRSFERRRPDGPTSFRRRETVEVSQEWLNTWRHRLPESQFVIEGDEGVTTDEGADGIPDAGWTRKDIIAWLDEKGVKYSGYVTKAAALNLVEEHLNPPAPTEEPTPTE